MGQVRELWLSCYLVLLSIDSKTRKQDNHSSVTWPKWYLICYLGYLGNVKCQCNHEVRLYILYAWLCQLIEVNSQSWFNSLPLDAIWCDRTRSTLIQVMACYLMAPSPYLILCWLRINYSKGRTVQDINHSNDAFVNTYILRVTCQKGPICHAYGG